MLKNMKSVLFAVLLLFTSLGHADEIHDLVMLKGYISKHCSKGCVDAGNLLNALQYVKKQTTVEPDAVLAIIRQESSFVSKATNKGNVGLMQVLLKYHRKKFITSNYFDAKDNIKVGTSIYEDCRKKHSSDLRQSFRCYNGYHYGDKNYFSKIQNHLKEIRALKFKTI